MTATPDPHPYHRTVEFAATLRDQTVRIVSKPGFANWERVSPAAILLAETVTLRPDARVLHLGGGPGGLGVFLARRAPEGSVLLVEANYVATLMAGRTLQANRIMNALVQGDPASAAPEAASADVAVLEVPPGRKFARRWLALAHAALKPGGQLYLAGPKAEGIESIIGDARALFGQAATLAYRDHHRVALATKANATTLPAWATEPGIAPGTWHHFDLAVAGESFSIASLPGVFSHDRLDEGTAFLLANLRVRPGERVLDIGCGWGAIGLVAARQGAARVDLIDVSLPAVAAAARNIAAAGLTNARALPSDALGAVADERYDLIVTNPPFHAGKAVDHDAALAFIADARDLLTPRGRLVVVANAFIRYERAMQGRYGSVETLAEDRRYHVLQATLREKRERDDEPGRP
jgi:16S rRNA (guanine1207-N2)-methyltransferase